VKGNTYTLSEPGNCRDTRCIKGELYDAPKPQKRGLCFLVPSDGMFDCFQEFVYRRGSQSRLRMEGKREERFHCWGKDCGCVVMKRKLHECANCGHHRNWHVSSQRLALIDDVLPGTFSQHQLTFITWQFVVLKGVDDVPWTELEQTERGEDVGTSLKYLVNPFHSSSSFEEDFHTFSRKIYREGYTFAPAARYASDATQMKILLTDILLGRSLFSLDWFETPK